MAIRLYPATDNTEQRAGKSRKASTERVLKGAKAFVKEKQAVGWKREDFADALKRMLESAS